MTEQYQQSNINQQRPALLVDQSNIDTTLTPPAIPIGNDVTFVLLANVGGPPTPYNVLLPNVRTVEGFFFYFRNASGGTVTLRAQTGQLINGAPTLDILANDTCIIVSDPVNNNVDPPLLPVGWTLIKNSPV